ncbi:MAG: hypothetical protein ABIQ31_24965, partial [Ferruginibacter sp.]
MAKSILLKSTIIFHLLFVISSVCKKTLVLITGKGFRIFSNPDLHFTNYLSTLYFCLHSRSASWRITGTLL